MNRVDLDDDHLLINDGYCWGAKPEIAEWCANNIGYFPWFSWDLKLGVYYYLFPYEDDALLFKLVWIG